MQDAPVFALALLPVLGLGLFAAWRVLPSARSILATANYKSVGGTPP
jgi:hypothetical protein